MIALPPGVRIYLACGVTDMRKGMVGLAMLVQQGLSEDHSAVRSMPFVDAALD